MHKQNIYCFDTSAFVTLHRYYPRKFMPSIWIEIEGLIKSKILFSHEIVFDEIVPKDGPKDDLANWLFPFKSAFRPITQHQLNTVPGIIRKYPKLIDSESRKDQADPWLIALLVEIMGVDGLFGTNSDYVLVSMESEKAEQKIPTICKDYSVRHMNLMQFFEANKWEIGIKPT